MNSPKRVLAIDDQPERVAELLNSIQAELEIVHPQDLEAEHIHSASVVLVDHHLEANEWPEREGLPFACQPQNGVALAVIIQAHLKRENFQRASPTAVALLSARLHEVTPGLPNPPEHVAAQACGLDWGFRKQAADSLPFRIMQLVDAVDKLPRKWPSDSSGELWRTLSGLLGLDSVEWEGTALTHLERCHPPMHQLAEWTDGISLVRWIAQRILPYPTFVVDCFQVAVRLGVKPLWMLEQLKTNRSLQEALEPARYLGILSQFLGLRWWVAGLDELLWKETGSGSLDSRKVKEWVKAVAGAEPEWLADDDTLILNEDLEFDGSTAPYTDCIEVRPDDWPPYASVPWTTLERASEHLRLRMLVSTSDLGQIENAEA